MAELKRELIRTDNLELDKEKRVLKGRAIVFNVLSEKIGGSYYEVIRRSAVEGINFEAEGLMALYNHDVGSILGSLEAGNLKIDVNSEGLDFELELNNTSYANDLYENVRTGVVCGCSFHMMVDSTCRDIIGYHEDGSPIIEVSKILKMNEITITPFPAYKHTSVETRSKGDIDIKTALMGLRIQLMRESLKN